MQVSWINPEDVAALAESLRQPVRQPAPAAQPLPEPPAEPLVVENPPLPVPAGVPVPDLAAFREKLQSIRDKAVSAGLLNATAVVAPPFTPPPAPAPVFTPAPASAIPAEIPPSPAPETLSAARAFQSEQALRWAAPAPAPVSPEVAEPPVVAPSYQTPAAETELASSASPDTFSEPETPAFPSPPPVAENAVFPTAPEDTPAPVQPFFEAVPEPVAAEVPAGSFDSIPEPQQPEVPVSPAATVKERLEAYAQWANQKWGAQELLIVDEFGDLLWGPPKKSGLVLSTMMAWNAAIRASAQAASGVVQTRQQMLPAGESLTLIPCSTRLGLLQIALVKAQAPWENETASLRETLQQVMDAHG